MIGVEEWRKVERSGTGDLCGWLELLFFVSLAEKSSGGVICIWWNIGW